MSKNKTIWLIDMAALEEVIGGAPGPAITFFTGKLGDKLHTCHGKGLLKKATPGRTIGTLAGTGTTGPGGGEPVIV